MLILEELVDQKGEYGRSRVQKALVVAKTQSAPASHARNNICMLRQGACFLSLLGMRLLPLSPLTLLKNKMRGEKRKKTVPKREKLCSIDRQALERDFSSQKKPLLWLLYKCSSVDGKSTKDLRNFPKAPGVIMIIRVRNTSGNLKVWDYLMMAKSAFRDIRMVQLESPELKKCQICALE